MYRHTFLARVWINRVRLPILHVVSRSGQIHISLSAFASENLVSRDGFGSPVSRQPAHFYAVDSISPFDLLYFGCRMFLMKPLCTNLISEKNDSKGCKRLL